ncbi:hypothetical protein K501DRAFT_275652 [Backusella circina FSU 941]|nr:hypothetical protein K501DRAFT_275652 [Backusella circina FSU 941]
MDKLPVEILNRVFDKLHFSQKTRCALVCRQWATLIHSYKLLYDLTIENSSYHKTSAFDDWKKRITQQPRWGKQVRELALIGCLVKKEDITILPTLFPYIRTLVLLPTASNLPNFDTTQSTQFEIWHNRLDNMIEGCCHYFTYHLLGTGIFSRLESITLTYDEYLSISPDKLFERFAHAPALKYLELKGFRVTFEILETLHKHAPNIVSLGFYCIQFISDSFPPSIQPAQALDRLKIFSGEFSTIQIHLWKRYILSKYPNVIDLVFNTGGFEMNSSENLSHTQILNPMLQILSPQLKSLGVTYFPFDPEWFAIMDKENAKLHTLQISAHRILQTIDGLLSFNQFRNLRVLGIRLMTPSDYAWLASTVHLEKLKLDFVMKDDGEEQHSVCLNQLLFFCPDTLKSLTIRHGLVTIATPICNTNSNIQSLKIKHGEIDTLATAFISEYCNRLQILSLIYSTITSWTVHLPKHQLSYLEVSTPDNKTNIKITSNDGTRIYSPNHRFTKVKRSMMKDKLALTNFSNLISTFTNILEKEGDEKTTIHITCQSLQNLFVSGHCAF